MKRTTTSLILILCALMANAQVTDKLIGSHWNGSVEIFTSLDISTKTFTDMDTLNGAVSFAQGETTFDAINNRYFNKTNLGITIINALTGAIIDTIGNSVGMKGIEYDQNSNKLLGSYWNGSVEIFTSLDISTKTFTDMDTLNGAVSFVQGESTFDVNNNRYFNTTNLGITIINALTGAIIDTIGNSIGMKGIEFPNVINTNGIADQINEKNLVVFPNPFSYETTIKTVENLQDATLTIYNTFGQVFKSIKNISWQEIKLQRDNLPSGLYFIQLTQYSKVIATHKLIISDL